MNEIDLDEIAVEQQKSSRIALDHIGTAGEYFVCAELCRQNYLALLTPKNNPLFDVVATNPKGSVSVAIQVKTRSVQNKQGWKLSAQFSDGPNRENLLVVLVSLKETGMPEFWVYDHAALAIRIKEVYKSYIDKPKRDGQPRKEVGFRWFDEGSFTEMDKNRKNNWEPIKTILDNV